MVTENLNRLADLHVHYTDDTSVSNILETAKKRGVQALGLIKRAEVPNDFDKYVDQARELGIKVVPGFENFALLKDGSRADYIALAFDLDGPIMEMYGASQSRQHNAHLAKEQMDYLVSVGFDFSGADESGQVLLDELLGGKHAEKAARFCAIIAGLEINATEVSEEISKNSKLWEDINMNYAFMDMPGKIMKFLYFNHFAVGRPGYRPVQRSINDVIDAVHASRGVVLYSPEGKYSKETHTTLDQKGIDGIMAWHGTSSELTFLQMLHIRRNGKLVLGGSDFDPEKNNWQLGIGKGDMYMTIRRFDDLRVYMKRKYGKDI